jgi:hypothetical protein
MGTRPKTFSRTGWLARPIGAGREAGLSTARPTRNRSAAGPAKASSISDWTPAARSMRQPGALLPRYSSSAVLPTPGSPCTTSARLSPARTASTSWARIRRSASRPVSSAARHATGKSPARCWTVVMAPPASSVALRRRGVFIASGRIRYRVAGVFSYLLPARSRAAIDSVRVRARRGGTATVVNHRYLAVGAPSSPDVWPPPVRAFSRRAAS